MGCNVSKDVKVEDQGNPENAVNGDQTSMSEEKAAEKIQASFRGYKTRKTLKNNGVLPAKENKTESSDKTSEKKEQSEEKNSEKPNSTQSTDDKEILDIDLSDKDLEKAAAKIQASYRQYSKKKQHDGSSSPTKEKEEPVQNDTEKIDENLEDIDLGDPAVEKAALKIQSTFRGFKVRKEVKDTSEDTQMTNGEKGEDEG